MARPHLVSERPPVLAGPPGRAGPQVERAPEGGVRDGDDPVHPHLPTPGLAPPSHLQTESSELEEGQAETEDVDDHPQDVWNILTEWALQRNVVGLVWLVRLCSAASHLSVLDKNLTLSATANFYS